MYRLLGTLLLICLAALGILVLVWLLGHLLVFLGIVLTGLVILVAKIIWFLLLAAIFGGLVYFLASTYRKP